MGQNSIVIFRNIIDALSVLPPEQYKAVSGMVYAYAFDGTEPAEDTDPTIRALFLSFKPQLSHNKARYETYIENAKKGGAPKGNKNAKKSKEQDEKTPEEVAQNETTKNNQKQPNDENEQPKTTKNNLISINNISINNIDVVDDIARTREEANESFLKEFFDDTHRANIEVLCMQLHVTPNELQALAREIIAEWELTDERHEDYNEQAKHLINQLRIKNSVKRKEQQNGKATATAAAGATDKYNTLRADTKAKKPLRSTI